MRRTSRLIAIVATTTAVATIAACAGNPPTSTGSSPAPSSASPASVAPAPAAGPSTREMVTNMVRCLTDAGWQVTATEEGYGSPPGVPAEQWPQYEADEKMCYAKFGYDKLPPPSVTAAEAAVLYDKLLVVADCVRKLGYQVAEPPSKQAFIEQLVSYPIPKWHPYNGPADTGGLGRVQAACPVPD